LKLRLDRHAAAGEGRPNSPDPQTLKLGEDEDMATRLLEAPSPEREIFATKRRADLAASSSAPPASDQDNPTLYTGRGSTIPHPPAAGATAGGEGISDPTACEVDFPEVFRKNAPPYCSGEEERPIGVVR
jgi:hypothetical protein